jgi:DNA polymerase-3 subunit alpha
MENSLKSTYGILVYQEQFMQISKEWSGFTGGQADTLRKAVGKKNIDLMKKVKPEFVAGAISVSGATQEMAEKFWDQLEEFANYCFNKSHAACYGLISYWTAYLKAHYPDAFMAALMTSDEDDMDRLAIEIIECQKMGIKVLAPDINESYVEFAVVPGQAQIRFGMAAVKGVGTGAVEEILRARSEGGKFQSIEDFVKRINTRLVNRRVWESLIKTGAFDAIGDRSDLLFNLDTILAYASKLHKDLSSGQTDLFGGLESAVAMPSIRLDPAPTKHHEHERLQWERELLGLYLSSHPLDRYDDYFSEQTMPIVQLTAEMDNKTTTIGGVISTIRQITTKTGSKMAFVGIEDKTGECEIVVFPKTYEEIGAKLLQDVVVRIKGKVNARDRDGNITGDVKLIADEITIVTQAELDEYQSTGKKMKAPKSTAKAPEKVARAEPLMVSKQPKLYVHVKDPNDQDRLLQLKQTFNQYPGESEIILVLGAQKESAVRLPFTANITDELQGKITDLYGAGCVALR